MLPCFTSLLLCYQFWTLPEDEFFKLTIFLCLWQYWLNQNTAEPCTVELEYSWTLGYLKNSLSVVISILIGNLTVHWKLKYVCRCSKKGIQAMSAESFFFSQHHYSGGYSKLMLQIWLWHMQRFCFECNNAYYYSPEFTVRSGWNICVLFFFLTIRNPALVLEILMLVSFFLVCIFSVLK